MAAKDKLNTTRARLAAYTRWSRTPDATAATAPARRAFMSRWDSEVDPDGLLAPHVRARLAEAAKKAHFTRMAYASAKARRR